MVVLSGLLLRVILAFAISPGRGFASDMDDFFAWANALGRGGPGHLYGPASGANYPPAYMYVLWGLHGLAGILGRITGATTTTCLVVLLKLPAVYLPQYRLARSPEAVVAVTVIQTALFVALCVWLVAILRVEAQRLSIGCTQVRSGRPNAFRFCADFGSARLMPMLLKRRPRTGTKGDEAWET